MTDEPDIDIIYDRIPVIACNQCGESIDVSNCEPLTPVECPHCNSEQTIPARFGEFLLTSTLGKGGMGAVYLAYDEALNRFVAIKVLLASFGEDAEFVRSFQEEAQAAAALNHPSIVQIYSFGQENGQPYIVMELVSGGKFSDMIEDEQQVDVPLVMQIGRDIASALAAAANAGLLHGDVKPENILLDERGTAKLVDFGLASTIGRQDGSGVWGTPNYIAPEKVRRQKVDERSDIYSLGATLYHALAGRPPFEGDDAIEVVKARLERPADDISEVVPGINKDVADLINRMLEAEPFRRYPTYSSLRGDLDKTLAAVGGAGAKGRKGRPKQKVTIRKRGKTIGPPDAPVPTPVADPEEASAPATVGRKGGKLIISKRSGQRLVASDRRDNDSENESGGRPSTVKRRRRRGSRIAVLIVLGVILIIGAGLAFMAFTEVQADKRTRRVQKLEISQIVAAVSSCESTDIPAAMDSIDATLSRAKVSYSNVNSLAALFLGPTTMTRLAVAATPPEPARPTPDEKSPEDAPPKDDPTKNRGDAEPAKEAADPVADDVEADTPEANSDAAEKDAAPQDAPAAEADGGNGEPKVENATPEVENPEPEVENAEPAPQPEPDAAPAVAEEPLPELAAYADANEITALYTNSVATYVRFTRAATELRTDGDALSDLATKVRETATAANTSSATDFVGKKLKELKSTRNEFDDQVRTFLQSVSNAVLQVASLDRDQETLESVRAAAEKKFKADEEEKARIAAEQQRKLDEQRKGEELAAKVLDERMSIRRRSTEFTTQIRANRFSEAARNAKRMLRDISTDEAKKEAKTLIERYELLVELHTFLIGSMKKIECQWCWQGTADIVGATTRGVLIRTQTDPIPWETVKPAQYLLIADKYLELAGDQAKRIDRARYTLAIGVYVVELGAPERATKYTTKALEIWDRGTFPDDVKRLANPLEDLGGGEEEEEEEEEEAPF